MEVLINNYCMGIQHIGIPTINIESTVNFYEQLGFNPSLIVNLCFSLLLSILQFSFAPLCTTNFFLF